MSHSEPDPDALAGLSDRLFTRFAQPGVPGASVGVFRRGTPILQRAFGMARLEPPATASVRTTFRLASLSKQFTAAAILILVERGALRLDTVISELLPELHGMGEPIRVHHLLTHTAGLWDYEELVPAGQTEQVKDAEVLALLGGCDRRHHFAPGASFRYSNSGYALLALLVERLGGCSFAEFLQEQLFRPLEMQTALAYQPGRSLISERAYGYSESAGGFVSTDQSLTSAVLGDGGVYASVADLACWEDALAHPRLLSPATLERMWSPAQLRDGTPIPYGHGWYVDLDRGRRRLTHHGESIGFRNAVIRYPREQLAVWVLTNRTAGAPWDLAQQIADQALVQLERAESLAPAQRWPFHEFG